MSQCWRRSWQGYIWVSYCDSRWAQELFETSQGSPGRDVSHGTFYQQSGVERARYTEWEHWCDLRCFYLLRLLKIDSSQSVMQRLLNRQSREWQDLQWCEARDKTRTSGFDSPQYSHAGLMVESNKKKTPSTELVWAAVQEQESDWGRCRCQC